MIVANPTVSVHAIVCHQVAIVGLLRRNLLPVEEEICDHS